MNIDEGTLKDLHVLGEYSHAGAARCVMQLVDRTRTEAGRRHLRKLLMSPYASDSEIIDAQSAHTYLAAHSDRFQGPIQRTICDGVERYLDCSWPTPHAAEGLTRWWETYASPLPKQYFRDVESGQIRIRALVQAANELRDQLNEAPPAPLRTLSSRLSGLLESADIVRLAALVELTSRPDRVHFDDHARRVAKKAIVELLECVGAADAMLSVGLATAEHGWSYPTISDGLAFQGLHHPLLTQAASSDLAVSRTARVCFITGPNMSGKSTLLRAIGIAQLLAHVGSGVPAKAMSFTPNQALFSCISVDDSLRRGESFYVAEVRRLQNLANILVKTPQTVGLIDEPFRGTNTDDAIAATSAIISKLLALPRAVTFVASHLSQVVPSFERHSSFQCFHFSADLKEQDIGFDYRLRPGVSTQRLGLILLQRERVLEILDAASTAEPARTSAVGDS